MKKAKKKTKLTIQSDEKVHKNIYFSSQSPYFMSIFTTKERCMT